jgi:hypothetical protein
MLYPTRALPKDRRQTCRDYDRDRHQDNQDQEVEDSSAAFFLYELLLLNARRIAVSAFVTV